ncbi:MAG TPA: PQQ-binding-like beta-propeller repeat protein, partial [Bryobacteraceae bacterium]|nr:PQQ-binding-like beta-propeller repeat protein [Bryobacteraceae bacterium]
MRRACLVYVIATVLQAVLLHAAEDDPGAKVFQTVCAVCHEQAGNGGRIPHTATLRRLSAAYIRQALESGVMQSQGANLSAAEKAAVAAYLGVAAPALPAASATVANRCPAGPAWQPSAAHGDWDGWGLGTENRRYQETGGIPAAAVPTLKLKWAYAIPDASVVRSQPAVYGGRVFIGGQDGSVFALDAGSGCTYWIAKVKSQVRSGIAVAQINGKLLVLVGDAAGFVSGIDAATGTMAWQRRLDENPYAMVTATPIAHNDRIYVG